MSEGKGRKKRRRSREGERQNESASSALAYQNQKKDGDIIVNKKKISIDTYIGLKKQLNSIKSCTHVKFKNELFQNKKKEKRNQRKNNDNLCKKKKEEKHSTSVCCVYIRVRMHSQARRSPEHKKKNLFARGV